MSPRRVLRMGTIVSGLVLCLALLAAPALAQTDPYTNTGGSSQGSTGNGSVLGVSTTNTPPSVNTGGRTAVSGGSLPITGGEVTVLALIGVSLLSIGVVLATVAARRESSALR